MSTAQAAWVPGTHFSRYEILGRLARGGMAEVWRAAVAGGAGADRDLAIKTMRPERAVLSDLVQMFINEATIASRFDHPAIIRVFDFGQLDERYFMAMEYVPGCSLRQLAQMMRILGKRLPRQYLLRIVVEISRALGYAHALADDQGPLGFAHRDVSPENIMVSFKGVAKLIDFGAAMTRDCPPPTWMFSGKNGHLSPERLRGENGDARTDVYSLGVVLYQYLTDRAPFEGPDVQRLIAQGKAVDPCRIEPTLPPHLGQLVQRAMALDPAARPANGTALAEELSFILTQGVGEELGAASEDEIRQVLTPSAFIAEVAVPGIRDAGFDAGDDIPIASSHATDELDYEIDAYVLEDDDSKWDDEETWSGDMETWSEDKETWSGDMSTKTGTGAGKSTTTTTNVNAAVEAPSASALLLAAISSHVIAPTAGLGLAPSSSRDIVADQSPAGPIDLFSSREHPRPFTIEGGDNGVADPFAISPRRSIEGAAAAWFEASPVATADRSAATLSWYLPDPGDRAGTAETFLARTTALDREAPDARAASPGPSVAAACFERGLELVQRHQYEEALLEWKRAIELEPESRLYRANLERLRRRAGEAAASPLAQHSIIPNPENS